MADPSGHRRCPIQITALGHSCILLSFEDAETNETTRILVDPWLSDHATGDAMGRFPRLRFQVADLAPVDAVYLSHAHCDHLDPYTLVRLWRELDSPPVLFLPVSLTFLLPVLREYLDGVDIRVLEGHTAESFRGLELLGFFDVGAEATNEDDVMVLVVTNGTERVLVEADARLSLELLRFREYISLLMCGPSIDSAVYLTTENELTGTMESRNCTTLEDRETLLEVATEELLEAVSHLYTPFEDPTDLWQGERVLRLVHGQGLTAPHELDARWQRILFPVRVADRVQIERAVAEQSGCRHHIDSLTVGHTHTIVAGRIEHIEPVPWLEMLDREEDRAFDVQLPFFPALPCAPLHAGIRDVQVQRARILALLNERFLPYLHGLRQPPVLHLLAAHGGAYRIRVHYGERAGEQAWDYVLRYGERCFVEGVASGEEQEAYWGHDLDDFLDGRCDEFSPFCRQQFPVEEMRLWVCLATPLLNSDLVSKKVRLHFERASQGLSPGSWVMEMVGDAEVL
jgi:L-ascorbate metabolism protein UlaG (beta-lactamase superfamily)